MELSLSVEEWAAVQSLGDVCGNREVHEVLPQVGACVCVRIRQRLEAGGQGKDTRVLQAWGEGFVDWTRDGGFM